MNLISSIKNKKAQLMELIFKEFTIGFLVGIVVTLVILIILIKNGTISVDLIEKIAPVAKK